MAHATTDTGTPSSVRSTRGYDIDADVEEIAIALARAEQADQRAELQERIVLLALPLADAIARRYAGRGIETDDLVQVARTALVKAVHRYRAGHRVGVRGLRDPDRLR